VRSMCDYRVIRAAVSDDSSEQERGKKIRRRGGGGGRAGGRAGGQEGGLIDDRQFEGDPRIRRPRMFDVPGFFGGYYRKMQEASAEGRGGGRGRRRG
jgi:hypothetical protein